ncbi:MAG: hypothetical protein FJX62_07180 [Alphaproteobacteria bacterium]|nr:hypothetical protein [Alphaproteobacteria bacterium]
MRISADFGEPILFRTTNADVYDATLKHGSLWLRSDAYYRNIEDQSRVDTSEGVNSSRPTIPMSFKIENGPSIQIFGPGAIGQKIVPHYIVSLHGSSISAEQIRAFGGHTFGIKNLSKLSAEVLYRASSLIRCNGYRYGSVSYQRTSLCLSRSTIGSAAIQLCENPPLYLNPLDTDVLRKDPVSPFIEQDEWRIAIFANGYLDGDANFPLQIKVDPSHFYA